MPGLLALVSILLVAFRVQSKDLELTEKVIQADCAGQFATNLKLGKFMAAQLRSQHFAHDVTNRNQAEQFMILQDGQSTMV